MGKKKKMLWPIVQLFFITGLVFTILSFSRIIDKFGQVLFMFFAAITWMAMAISMLKIRFMGAGATGMVFYDFTAGSSNTPPEIVYLFGSLGLILLITALLRAITLTYTPVTDGISDMTGVHQSKYTKL